VQASPTQASAATTQESSNELFVTVGKSVIVNSALPIERVSVGFGEVAEATAVSMREVLVNGKAPGETSLIVWQQGGGKLFFDVTVRPSRFLANNKVDAIRREISKELPGQNINLSFENEMVFLRGTVKDLTSADRAVAIASTVGKVVNLLYVNTPAPESQILLKVKFASVDRNLSNQLGINIFSTGATNTIGTITTGQYSPPSLSSSGNGSGGGSSSGSSVSGSGVTVTLSNALNLFFFAPI
jgi:pilus assembly protein CpaC